MRRLLLGLLLIGVSAQAQRPAILTGRVVADTSMRPIGGVEVFLPELSKSVRSDGKGAFRITDIPPGRHNVRARLIGYAGFSAEIEFRNDQTAEVSIVLPRVPPLDTVRVVGQSNLPLSYLENRAVGLGHYWTRDDLEKQGNRKLGDILAVTPGLGIVQGRQSQGWIQGKRFVASVRSIGAGAARRPAGSLPEPGGPMYLPDDAEKARGMKAGCYSRVYLDNMLINTSSPAEPVDVNQFISQSIEAIEFYASPAQVPMKYSRLDTSCGVLVIHTRKSR